ncbi:phosphohydrolase [Methylobacterium sp. Leaf125]|uniref:HD-GYP domain-containing protein n=1 Tax=Methylobacterium sp. Leaf125 TaxID=1736265 RepID=UPI0006F2B639|nr:HD domain-containing phosphohydrolase [Methylobacterium sp. Leaf125]KQQ45026.1 phosphohydrolase [Methylobacterium sp. Leaf125]
MSWCSLRPDPILVVTDKPEHCTCLLAAAQHIGECRILVTTQPWSMSGPVLGVIADVDLKQSQTRACLDWLDEQLGLKKPPILFLTDSTASAALREARAYGATACLPRYTEARAVVASLFRMIHPSETVTDVIVRRGASRTSDLFEDMFKTAPAGTVDLAAVEGAIDPVLNAIEEGGLARWLDVVWEHDDTTFQHCLLVAGLTVAFSQSLGLSRVDQRLMARAALVHDIGKAQIPLAILNKPGKLDTDEMAVMRTHPALGYDLLKASGKCDPVTLAVARHHHEMLDGSGYPDGLSSNAIADPVRLLTICDIYAALIERRSYKAPFSSDNAMHVLAGMGGKLEGALVKAFGKAMLSSGERLGRAVA